MSCRQCKSDRIASVTGKTSDLCFYEYKGKESDGYVPTTVGIAGPDDFGDYIRFSYCLECGQIQGKFPIPEGTVMEVFEEKS